MLRTRQVTGLGKRTFKVLAFVMSCLEEVYAENHHLQIDKRKVSRTRGNLGFIRQRSEVRRWPAMPGCRFECRGYAE